MTFEIAERLLSTGEVFVPFDLEQAKRIAADIARLQAEAVAVCFLHSWANPENEKRMGELIASTAPDLLGLMTASSAERIMKNTAGERR